ncbi:hypothetical protein ACHQM5_010255 [Ranunculus cassubicifolius]
MYVYSPVIFNPSLPLLYRTLISTNPTFSSISNNTFNFNSLHTPKKHSSISNQNSISCSRRNDLDFEITSENDEDDDVSDEDIVDVDIVKLGKNERRITCRIGIDANLETVWRVLTDYEKLADFIPGLAVCQLVEKVGNRARLFQIGQQNLAFGLKFNAKGTVDCYEKDLVKIPFGQRRDIEFEMIEGDFQLFEGKWSIEETDRKESEYETSLTYVVDVKPKLWLPVRLVEGRLCKEIKLNLLCIKQQAQRADHGESHTS